MMLDPPLATDHLPRPDPARGIFETLLVADGRPVELDAHLGRLAASARELFGPPAMARVQGPARALVESVCESLGDGATAVAPTGDRAAGRTAAVAPTGDEAAGRAAPALHRLRVTLAPDDRGRLDLASATAAIAADDVFPAGGAGPRLTPIAVPGGLGAHKWADRRLLESAAPAGALALIVDADGSVLEAERANVFAVIGDTLVTPPADGRILAGVTRARVIDVARAAGLEVDERPLALEGLAAAPEAFLSGSIRGVEPIGEPGRAAPATALVAAALRARWLGPPATASA